MSKTCKDATPYLHDDGAFNRCWDLKEQMSSGMPVLHVVRLSAWFVETSVSSEEATFLLPFHLRYLSLRPHVWVINPCKQKRTGPEVDLHRLHGKLHYYCVVAGGGPYSERAIRPPGLPVSWPSRAVSIFNLHVLIPLGCEGAVLDHCTCLRAFHLSRQSLVSFMCRSCS